MTRRHRQAKLRAREALHRELSVPAFYFPHGDPSEAHTEINVRVHSKWEALGDMAGTSFEYAERREEVPKIVFDLREVTPQRNAVVVVSETEGYAVDHYDPSDDFTTTAAVKRLSNSEVANYPAPEPD